MSVEWVQTKFVPFLVIDPTRMYEKDPDEPNNLRLRLLHKIPKNLRLAITRLKLDRETGRPLEIHLVDKLAAAMALIRSLTPDTTIQNNNINLSLAERLEARRQRAQTPLARLTLHRLLRLCLRCAPSKAAIGFEDDDSSPRPWILRFRHCPGWVVVSVDCGGLPGTLVSSTAT